LKIQREKGKNMPPDNASTTGHATVPAVPVGAPVKAVLSPTDPAEPVQQSGEKFDPQAAAKRAFENIVAKQTKKAMVPPPVVVATAPAPASPPAPPVSKESPPTGPDAIPVEALEAIASPVPAPDSQNELETVPLEKVDEKIRPNLAKMRTALEAARKEAADFKKQVGELSQKQTVNPDDFKKLQEQNKTLSETLGRLSLENHPEFQAKYDGPKEAILANMKPLLVAYGVAPEEVDKVAANVLRSSPDKRLALLKQHVPEEQVAMVFGALAPLGAQADQIEKARAAELVNHAATLQAIRAREQLSQQERSRAFLITLKQGAMDEVTSRDSILQEIPGNEKWNAIARSLRANAEALFESQDPMTQAKALVESATVPAHKAIAAYWKKKCDSMAQALKERNIAMPGVESRQPVESAPTRPASMTAKQAMDHLAAQVRAGTVAS
jgi:hypothetical protein